MNSRKKIEQDRMRSVFFVNMELFRVSFDSFFIRLLLL